MFALTSLSPALDRMGTQRQSIRSWRDAGLQVRSFNHPAEVSRLASVYEVDFVPVENTSIHVFGRHYAPINAMLDWGAAQDAPLLLINSDIELRLTPWELNRIRWISEGGLCYFVRHNHNGEAKDAQREPTGIDAFLLHGRDARLFPKSWLSMGQPFWDFWLPYTLDARGRPLFSVEFPAAFHRNHPEQWRQNYRQCAIEFDRVAGVLEGDQSYESCCAMGCRVRTLIETQRIALSRRPIEIRRWAEHTFADRRAKTFLELGAHCGSDTAWMAAIPGTTVHAFEPDPRNSPPDLDNVITHRSAIADRDGAATLTVSKRGWGRAWTCSSSIKAPKNHLMRFPVTFGETIEVNAITLDTVSRELRIGEIDFIWASVQGAEAEMIHGGPDTFARTRYLFTQFSDDELYENQPGLSQILEMLPDFLVLELWPAHVLLANRRLHR